MTKKPEVQELNEQIALLRSKSAATRARLEEQVTAGRISEQRAAAVRDQLDASDNLCNEAEAEILEWQYEES